MAMRPLGRDEALQHLFVLGTGVFLIVAPIFLVKPPPLQYSLMGLGAFFMLDRPHRGRGITEAYDYLGWS